MSRPGWIARWAMPSWLRGSALEAPARRFARCVKSGSLRAERLLRRGRSRCKLPSVDEWVWLDFDFAVGYPLPKEDPLLSALLADLKPGQTFYDVGSFVGWYAIAASRRLGEGRVVAFEPVPETARLLRRHCALNRAEDRVRVVEAACSNAAGMVSMPVWPTIATTWASGNALRNVYPQEAAQPSWMPVCTVRLDDFVRAGAAPPDVLKIDVEGAELWTLQGAEEVLRTARPRVFLEVHAFAWRLFDTTEVRLRSFLEDVGYELHDLAPPHEPMRSIPEYGHALLRPAS